MKSICNCSCQCEAKKDLRKSNSELQNDFDKISNRELIKNFCYRFGLQSSSCCTPSQVSGSVFKKEKVESENKTCETKHLEVNKSQAFDKLEVDKIKRSPKKSGEYSSRQG